MTDDSPSNVAEPQNRAALQDPAEEQQQAAASDQGEAGDGAEAQDSTEGRAEAQDSAEGRAEAQDSAEAKGRAETPDEARSPAEQDAAAPSVLDPTQPESLLEHLHDAPRPVSVESLAEELGVSGAQRKALQASIDELAADGRIVATRDGRYGVPAKMNLVVGRLSCHEKGYGFVIPRERGEDEKDLYIPSRKLGDAMHGDLVVARREATRGDRTEGRVIRLLRRARSQVVGTFESGRHFGFVAPLDQRIGYQVYVPGGEFGGAKDGQIVTAEITSYPQRKGHRNPEGRVVEILGDHDDPRIDVEVIIREFALAHEFPKAVMKEAEAMPTEVAEADLEGRTDFRELPIVTIDGENAKDFDDAVYVEKLPNGNFQLAVHIADVSAYIPVGSAIDQEAKLRATSVYFPDRVVPMLPERLSNEICSLKPGVDRLVQSVIMEINREGRTVNYEFHDGVIRSAERMTYKAVATLLDDSDDKLTERYAGHLDHLQRMAELCDVLRTYRNKRGSIDFDLPEPELLINLRGEVEDIFRSERNLAHRIIEEFMIRANEVVASHLTWEDTPTLYRVHEGPDLEKVEAFREFIGGLGLTLGGGSSPKPRDFQRLVEHLDGQPGERVIIYMMLRTMKQARYQPENIGHFGLASERYAHFTSPIRRYPDLIVHRTLRVDRGSDKQKPFDVPELQGELRRIGHESSERERNAEEAERRYVDWKTVQFMADKVGEEFEALVTGVHSYGFFIELDRFFVEGLVHVSSLDDDYYRYDDRQHTLHGEHTGRKFTLGCRVKVQLAKVDRGRRRLDFAVVEGPMEAGIAPLEGEAAAKGDAEAPGGRRRKRRRRRRKDEDGQAPAAAKSAGDEDKGKAEGKDKREEKKGARKADDKQGADAKRKDDTAAKSEEGKGEGRGRRRRSRRGRGGRSASSGSADTGKEAATSDGDDAKGKKKKTTRRGRGRSASGGDGDDKRAARKPRSRSGSGAKSRSTKRKPASSGRSDSGGRSSRTSAKSAASKPDSGATTSKPAADKSADTGKGEGQRPKVNPYLTDL